MENFVNANHVVNILIDWIQRNLIKESNSNLIIQLEILFANFSVGLDLFIFLDKESLKNIELMIHTLVCDIGWTLG